ncbi:MAG: GIY-YIG nuclease family protein [Candidatus Kerfeldbacteria bacterium]
MLVEASSKTVEGHQPTLKLRLASQLRNIWYVYGLRCNDGSLYIGSTDNVERRLTEHRNGKTPSLRYILPLELQFYIAVRTEAIARKLEIYCKTGSGKAVIKKRFLSDEAYA